MRDDSSRWVEVTPSQFTYEADGLRQIRTLPPDLARDTLAARLVDHPAAATTLDRGILTR